MAITKGTGTIKRHGKNFIGDLANSRLQEAVKPYQQIGLNALKVDSFEVQYYRVAKSTTICTCKQVQTSVLPDSKGDAPELPPVLNRPNSDIDGMVRIDYNRPLFGFPVQGKEEDSVDEESDLLAIDDEPSATQDVLMTDQIMGASAECGICYKQGFVPGYELYGYIRSVLTTHAVEAAYGYQINQSTAPNRFEQVDTREGYITFSLDVPKYFKGVQIAVRDNTKFLPDEVVLDATGSLLSMAYLRTCAGTSCLIKVKAAQFTHVTVDFNIGSDPVLANLAQGTKTLDWSQFDTFGSIQMILPMTIPDVTIADVIYVPKRNMSFKVTDINYLRTAQGANLDWQVSVRILQPQESLKSIHRTVRLG